MSMVDYYKQKISDYEWMYELCLKFLKFKHGEPRKKSRLLDFKVEVKEKGNKNRVKAAKRIADQASYEEIALWRADEILAKMMRESEYSEKVRRFDSYIRELNNKGPKEYLVECLEEIVNYKKCLKQAEEDDKKEAKRKAEEERERREEELQKRMERESYSSSSSYSSSYTPSYSRSYDYYDGTTGAKVTSITSKATARADKKPPKGKIAAAILANSSHTALKKKATKKQDINYLEEIIKSHIKDKNPYLDNDELNLIKTQFEIDAYNGYGHSYLSNRTIQNLFSIRIVSELIDRRDDVESLSILESLNSLYEIAYMEMAYRRELSAFGREGAMNYERALDRVLPVDRDYVEAYTRLYEKIQKHYKTLSKEEREEFDNRITKVRDVQVNGYLLSPEEFRKKVNEKGRSMMDNWSMYTSMETYYIIDELSHCTKYMTAEELASYYHSLKVNRRDINEENLQRIFANLISRKMPGLNKEDEKDEEASVKRTVAACREYLKEEPKYIDASDIKTDSNYAKIRVESRKAVSQKRKEYFRMSKFKQSLQLMNFKKLQKLIEKGVLTEEEIKSVKGMF